MAAGKQARRDDETNCDIQGFSLNVQLSLRRDTTLADHVEMVY